MKIYLELDWDQFFTGTKSTCLKLQTIAQKKLQNWTLRFWGTTHVALQWDQLQRHPCLRGQASWKIEVGAIQTRLQNCCVRTECSTASTHLSVTTYEISREFQYQKLVLLCFEQSCLRPYRSSRPRFCDKLLGISVGSSVKWKKGWLPMSLTHFFSQLQNIFSALKHILNAKNHF